MATSARVHKLVRGALIAGILFGPPLLAVTPVLRGDTVMERADAWVASRGTAVPTQLDDFSALPLAYRKAVYRSLAPQQRVSLWQEQITAFAATLTDARQRATVLEVGAALRPEMFGKEHPQPDPLKVLCEKLGQALTLEQRRTFANLGDYGQPGLGAQTRALIVKSTERFAELTNQWFAVSAGDASTASVVCNCAIETACSSCPGYCRNGPPYPYDLCIPAYSPEECGCFWQYQCDGNCQDSPNGPPNGGGN